MNYARGIKRVVAKWKRLKPGRYIDETVVRDHTNAKQRHALIRRFGQPPR